MVVQPWKVVAEQVLPAGSYRKVREITYELPDGRREVFTVKHEGGPVCILALTKDRQVVLAREFRPGPGVVLDELPGGEPEAGETNIEAAARELLEETGYRAGRIDYLMSGPTSAGMSNEILAFVLARDLERVEDGGGDETEEIRVHEVPRHDVAYWLVDKLRAGYSIDPKIFAGLYMLEHSALFAR